MNINIINSFKQKKSEKENFKIALKTATPFNNLLSTAKFKDSIPQYVHNTLFIINNCTDINKEDAKYITKIIPLEETILTANYAKEVISNINYFIILTDKYFWLINENYYGTFYYKNLNCSIIKNKIMSKIVLINNKLMEINGNSKIINNFIQVINDEEYRKKQFLEKSNYLCGIIPTKQLFNKYGIGLSTNNNYIIIHTEQNNQKYSLNEIENYEILLDNQLYNSKKTFSSKRMNSFQNSCFQINFRITLTNNQTITIPILKPNKYHTKYNNHETSFIKSLNFANDLLILLNKIYYKY